MRLAKFDPERHLGSLIDAGSDVVTVVTTDLTIVFQTGAGARLLGYERSELVGTKFAELVESAGLDPLRDACAGAANGVACNPVELRLRHRDGNWVDCETAVQHDPEAGLMILSTRDARERKRAERKLRRHAEQQAVVASLGARALAGEELHELTIQAASEVARTLGAEFAAVHRYLPDHDAFVLSAGVGDGTIRRNEAALDVVGSQPGLTLVSGKRTIVSDWATEKRFSEGSFMCASGMASGITTLIPAQPHPFGVLNVQSAEPHHFDDDDALFLDAIANVLASAIGRLDIEERIRHQVLHDSVTALPNRTLFEDRLAHALAAARRHDRSLAVLFVDLDNFKRVNDSLGHAIGDEVLMAVAKRLSACLRAEDTLARFGGDEFVVLLPEIESDEEWEAVVDRIEETLRGPLATGGHELLGSVTVGIAIGGARDAAKDAHALVRDADLAMYAAKQRGPGQRAVFGDEMYQDAVHRLDLIGDLYAGFKRCEFEAYFQPIVTLGDGSVVGLEALMRWSHPRHGLMSPVSFLALAEETGLIVPLGRRVLREACECLSRWQRSDPRHSDLYVTVNLSDQEVQADDLVDAVGRILRETGIPPSTLILEMTDGMLLTASEEAVARLRELKALGVRLAVDDFGHGSSVADHLQRFPIDILKIDRTVIDRLGEGAAQEPVVAGIVELAREQGLETIAEGIETPAQAAALREMHVGLGQGFHFAKPLEPGDVDGLIAAMPARPAAA